VGWKSDGERGGYRNAITIKRGMRGGYNNWKPKLTICKQIQTLNVSRSLRNEELLNSNIVALY
jgi:hypothetical protein